MAMNLPTLTRMVDMYGQSGNPVALDPMFFPVGGAALTTLTYVADQGGETPPQPGFTVAAGNNEWLMTAIPLGAFNNDSAIGADQVVVEFECDTSGAGGAQLMFYHYSVDHYDSDGATYLCQVVNGGGTADIKINTRTDDAASYNQVGSTVDSGVTDGWIRARCTLGVNGSNKTLKIEVWDSGAWVTQIEDTTLTDLGDMFGVGWRSQGASATSVRGPNGAMGPIVTWKGPSFVGVISGQSEMVGRAPGLQIGGNTDIANVNRQGVFNSPMTDPWLGTNAAHSTWTGITTKATAPAGSFGIEFSKKIQNTYTTQLWNCIHPLGGLSSTDMLPAATRYDTTNRSSARDLMTAILVGDGRTENQRLVHFIFQGTADAGAGVTGATYKSNIETMVTRIETLFPTTDTYLSVMGDRTFNTTPTTESENLEIRNAQNQIINEGTAKLMFDDEDIVGTIGTGTGWDNPGDTLHPGTGDNLLLSGMWFDNFIAGGQQIKTGLRYRRF